MSIKKFETKPILIEYYCDDCDVAVQHAGREVDENGKEKWKHRCPMCGSTYLLDRNYSYVNFDRGAEITGESGQGESS